MKKTYKELFDIGNYINQLKPEPGSRAEKILQRIANKLKPHLESCTDQLDELRLNRAFVNDKGVLQLNSDGDYTFTKDELKALKEEIKTLKQKTFVFTPVQIINLQDIKEYHNLSGWVHGFEVNEEAL